MIGGIVLAGGRSSRMGADKAMLDWHGRPLVVHVAQTLARAVDGPVVIVAAAGQHLPPLPELVHDRHPERGPLEGLAAGLAALAGRADAATAVAVDMPLISGDLLARIASKLRDGDDAVAPMEDGRPLPLGAVYRTSLARLAAERAASADRSLRGLLRAVATREIALTEAELATLASLDTPEAYAAALRA